MEGSQRQVVLAYRHLYKSALQAIRYSKPARYTLRDRIRKAFRETPADKFSQARVDKTIEFLQGADQVPGIERLIVKNLLHIWYWQDPRKRVVMKGNDFQKEMRKSAYEQLRHTIHMLNESMGMCLPT